MVFRNSNSTFNVQLDGCCSRGCGDENNAECMIRVGNNIKLKKGFRAQGSGLRVESLGNRVGGKGKG